MEADWSVEIAPGLPEIIVPWSAETPADEAHQTVAWRDLRLAGPQLESAILFIPSAAAEPALAAALRALHAPGSPWFTSKCDLWTTDPANENESPDPYEFDAADLAPVPLYLCASYLDILSSNSALVASFSAHETLLQNLTAALRSQSQAHARIDFVLRAARIHNTHGFAFTAYAAGCGLTASNARRAWQLALARLIAALFS